MNSTRRILIVIVVGLAVSGSVLAEPRNGATRWVEREASAGLAAEVQKLGRETDDRVWLSYTVPMLDGEHRLCCHRENDRGVRQACDLDDDSYSVTDVDELMPEGGRELQVYLELDHGDLVRVRAYDTQCRMEARPGTVYRVRRIDAADSVAFLSEQLRDEREEIRDGATMAVAFHAHPAAGKTLMAATRTREPAEVRQNAAFWLGITRADESFATLQRMVLEDPSAEVREHVVFAISLGDSVRATDFLFELARESEEADVRGQALFWLGQKAGDRVAEMLGKAAFDDPELEVKEQAVFALSQLPDGEGVTRLIEVATTHKHPEIRKVALFWLGQSHDPRALDLFEQVLD